MSCLKELASHTLPPLSNRNSSSPVLVYASWDMASEIIFTDWILTLPLSLCEIDFQIRNWFYAHFLLQNF